MDESNLDEMKYSEIRTLAKSLGIKANMKVEKLRKAIAKHYKNQNDTSAIETNKATKSSSSENEESEKENSPAAKKTRGRVKRGRKATSASEATSRQEDKTEDSERESSPVTKKRRGRKPKASSSETVTSEENTEDETVTRERRAEKNKTEKLKPKRNVRIASPEVTKTRKSLSSIKSPLSRTSCTPGNIKSTPSSNKMKSPSTLPSKKRISTAQEEKQAEKTQKRKRSESETRKPLTEENNSSEIIAVPENKRQRKSSTSSTTPISTPRVPSTKSTPKERKSTSPGVKSLIKAMDGLTSEEMKANLLEALDKKAKEKAASESPKSSDEAKQSTSAIPRFTEFLAKKKEQKKGASTPDWKKIHKKEFSKWDSIEVYMEKKKKRAEGLTGSLQRAQKLLQETQSAVRKLNNAKTPQITKPISSNGSRSSFQSPKVFKPTTLSTKDLNLKFGPRKRSQEPGCKISSLDTRTVTPNPSNTMKITPKPSNTKKVTPKSANSRTVSSRLINTNTVTPKPTNPKTVTPKPTSSMKVAQQPAKSKTITPKPMNTKTITARQKISISTGASLVHSKNLNRKSVATPVVSSKVTNPSTSGKLNETFSTSKNTIASDISHENIENKLRSTKGKSPRKVNSENSMAHLSAQTSSRKSLGDGLSKGGTPFKFSNLMNSSVNLNTSSVKKSSFDLKASLSKPLSWKPHKGKLKPLDLNTSSYKHIGVNKTNFKTPQTQTIEDRRRAAANNRADKKFQAQMNKRGITS